VNNAETLRKAASLMRERAEAATAGPWSTYADETDHIVFDQYGIGVQSDASHDVVCYSGQVYSRDAAHIASWHPAVALAVADWLEVVATRYESMLDTFAPGSRAGAVTAAENVTGWSEALAVARAYLGGEA